MQMWKSDGLPGGTMRAFDQTQNDLDIDAEAMDADWPPVFGQYDGTLYYSGNFGTGTTQLPEGGLTVENEQVVTGVDQALAVLDVDTPPDATLEVRLSCGKGLLSLKYVHGLSFLEGDGFEDEVIEINGTIKAINAAFRNLHYRGLPGKNGWDTIDVAVRDKPLDCEGNTSLWLAESTAPNASSSEDISEYYLHAHDPQRLANLTFCDMGAKHTVTGSINVYISSVNDAPRVDVTLPMLGTGLTLRRLSSFRAEMGFWVTVPERTFVVSDSDMNETVSTDTYNIAGDPPMTVTIKAMHGIFTLGTLKNIALVAGDGVEDRMVRFMASLVDVNNALTNLRYLCSDQNENPCYPGTDELSVHVDDNGYSGRGGALTDIGSLPITILPPSESVDEGDAPCGCEIDGETFCTFSDGEAGECALCSDYKEKEDCTNSDALADKGKIDCAMRCFLIDPSECFPGVMTCRGSGREDARTCADGSDPIDSDGDGFGYCVSPETSNFFPAGSVSWHDVTLNTEAIDEPRATKLLGDQDYWDD